MNYSIYISNNINYSNYHIYLSYISNYLLLNFNFVDNYDTKIDFLFKSKNQFTNQEFTIFKNNITIINCLKNNYLLMDKNIFSDYNYTPYFFTIDFNNLFYDKKLMKSLINNYNYNPNFGNDLWILKNTRSGRGIGTLLVSTNDLLNLESNNKFIEERNKFKNKTSYIIQKYLEKPILNNNKKYDIRVYILLLTSYKNNKIIYKFYLYKHITSRFTTKNYTLDNLDNKIHLTNMEVQNELNSYNILDFINEELYNKIYDDVHYKIKKFIKRDKFKKILYEINDYPYVYDIFALDILLDKDYNSYLIDFNTNPGFKSRITDPKLMLDSSNNNNIMNTLLFCIFIKLIKKYDKFKHFINDNNSHLFKTLRKNYKFNHFFKFITKI